MTDDDVNDRQLVGMYRELAEITKVECDTCPSVATKPYRCCHKWACELAKEYALWQWNVELNFTGHVDIPFMDKDGRCIVAPHLRPMCASHICSAEETGRVEDPEWSKKYFELRRAIADLEEARRQHVSKTSYGM